MRKPPNKRTTLCWSCGRFSGRCSWSARFEPVEGWEAEPRRLSLGARGSMVQSYTVYRCPQYERDSEEDGNERRKRQAAAQAL